MSYYDPDGYYAFDEDLFDWPLTARRLPPLSNYSESGVGNGVYNTGGPGFPHRPTMAQATALT